MCDVRRSPELKTGAQPIDTSTLVSLLYFFFALTACSNITLQSYPGPRFPSEQTAVLKGTHHVYPYAIFWPIFVRAKVLSVDGKSAHDSVGYENADEIEILPGIHEVSVFLEFHGLGNTSTSRGFRTYVFTADAAHTYKVDGNWNFNREHDIWIIDEQTGQIVAGNKP